MLLIVSCGAIGAGHAETTLSRLSEARFTLRHSSLLSARGGGEKGWARTLDKAATLCALLGHETMKIEDVDQYKHPNEGFGTASGATTSIVECFAAGKRPAEALPVHDFDIEEANTRMAMQAAIDSMLAAEEKERRKEEKLAARSPEKIAAEEAKQEAKRRKELEAIRKREERARAKALKKLVKRGRGRVGPSV